MTTENDATEIQLTQDELKIVIEAFRKAITPRRLELLNVIKASRPRSINELALLARRNIKNVAEDTRLLAQVGLLEINEIQNRVTPKVDYDEIDVRVAV